MYAANEVNAFKVSSARYYQIERQEKSLISEDRFADLPNAIIADSGFLGEEHSWAFLGMLRNHSESFGLLGYPSESATTSILSHVSKKL